ncbi:helix-turn-helix domain-containing protein [Streptomyces mirabilis]|uniref:helix-turn-helix domain-containing protein n=1 Tax=Streptomyces mirabilis TaxID=68239 RepID=UPI003687A93D
MVRVGGYRLGGARCRRRAARLGLWRCRRPGGGDRPGTAAVGAGPEGVRQRRVQWAKLEPLLPVGRKPGRPPVHTKRAALEGWVRGRSTPQAWALRCRIILACAEGASNKDVAAQLGSTPHAVGRWRARFVQYRIAGLGDLSALCTAGIGPRSSRSS